MNKSPRPNFMVRIAGCGTARKRHDYSTLKEDNALVLALKAVEQMTDSLVDESKQEAFKYELACSLMQGISLKSGIDKARAVYADINTADDRQGRWRKFKCSTTPPTPKAIVIPRRQLKRKNIGR